jgi:peptide/nickel transport system substrate-binding protein
MMQLPEFQHTTRRRFLAGMGGVAAGAVVSACSLSTSPSSTSKSSGPKGKEAPDLAKLAKAGKLPKVADRMPKKPAVVQASPQVGQYGGVWRTATMGAGDESWWWRVAGYEPLVRIEPFKGTIQPNIAESYKVNSTGTEFTFSLKQGIKWSDGQPFTADDIVFWWEDYATNKTLSPTGPPYWMISNGVPGSVAKTDDHTVVFSFHGPNGFLPFRLADSDGEPVAAMPKHYLKQFHQKYSPSATTKAKAAGMNSWSDLFLAKCGDSSAFVATDLPVIRPWIMISTLGKGNTIDFDRNPYYWKVDQDGSQLPYIDKVSMAVIQDVQTMLLKATNGEFSYQSRAFNVPANKPVLSQNAQKSKYHLTNLTPGSMNVGVIALNMTIKDPVKRKIYRNRDFRVGLSYALDRRQLIESVLQRQGAPWQAAPRDGSRYFDEEMATQYTEHNLTKANDYLDKAFPKKNSKGERLGPDGRPIVLNFLASTSGGDLEALYLDMQPIMKQQWAKVGIGMSTTSMERSLFGVKTGNEVQDALMWTGFGGSDLTLPVDPRWYVPQTTSQSNWAKQWVVWYNTGGKSGEEPPDTIKEGYTLYDKALAAVSIQQRDSYLREMLKLAKSDFWVIGTISTPVSYAVVSDKFMNVPKTQPDCWPYPQPGQLHCEMLWLKS